MTDTKRCADADALHWAASTAAVLVREANEQNFTGDTRSQWLATKARLHAQRWTVRTCPEGSYHAISALMQDVLDSMLALLEADALGRGPAPDA